MNPIRNIFAEANHSYSFVHANASRDAVLYNLVVLYSLLDVGSYGSHLPGGIS